MNGSWFTMLVNRFRTCTGASSESALRSTCRKTATSTASFMVDAAWNQASALYDHWIVVSASKNEIPRSSSPWSWRILSTFR